MTDSSYIVAKFNKKEFLIRLKCCISEQGVQYIQGKLHDCAWLKLFTNIHNVPKYLRNIYIYIY